MTFYLKHLCDTKEETIENERKRGGGGVGGVDILKHIQFGLELIKIIKNEPNMVE